MTRDCRIEFKSTVLTVDLTNVMPYFGGSATRDEEDFVPGKMREEKKNLKEQSFSEVSSEPVGLCSAAPPAVIPGMSSVWGELQARALEERERLTYTECRWSVVGRERLEVSGLGNDCPS